MSRADKYKDFFNQEYLMGPNSIRLLDEMLEKYPIENGLKVLDLGCGKGLTSLFLAKETNACVYATDLWISATENYNQFKEWEIDQCVVPVHSDANDLPFANEYFDVVVSIDSFHYFATQKDFFQLKILPLLKKKGIAIIAMPGLREEIQGSKPPLILEWINSDENEFELFHSREWWKNHFGTGNGFEILQDFDLENFALAWNDWFLSGHPYALRDGEYFKKGVDKYLSIVGFVIEKK